jgi:hypothetical protein
MATHLGDSRICYTAHTTQGFEHGRIDGDVSRAGCDDQGIFTDVEADDFEDDAGARVAIRVARVD